MGLLDNILKRALRIDLEALTYDPTLLANGYTPTLDDMTDPDVTSPAMLAGHLNGISDALNRLSTQTYDLFYPTVINAVSTSHTWSLDDVKRIYNYSAASTVTINVPSNATMAFPLGASIVFYQRGAGVLTFGAGAGATLLVELNTKNKSAGVNARCMVQKVATNQWILSGSTVA